MASRYEKEQRRARRRSKRQGRDEASRSRWRFSLANTRVVGRLTVGDILGGAALFAILLLLDHFFGIVPARSL